MGHIKKQFIKYTLTAVILILILIAWLGFSDRGFIHLYRMDKERQAYIDKIVELERMNTELMEQIKRLREDKDYIETVARRELGLVKDNELIIKFKSGGGE
jgi:cell division protein FtsB